MGKGLLALLFVFTSLPARADVRSLWLAPLRGAWHWVAHHKVELAADLTMVAAAAADVETSYRSQSNSSRCGGRRISAQHPSTECSLRSFGEPDRFASG